LPRCRGNAGHLSKSLLDAAAAADYSGLMRSTSSRILALLAGSGCAALAFAFPCLARADARPTPVARAADLVSTVLANYAGDNEMSSARYFRDGRWYATDNTQQWASTQGGAALAAASLWSSRGRSNRRLLDKAIDTIETAFSTRQAANGSFTPPSDIGDTQSPPIATEFFGRFMGDTYLLVRSRLSPSQQRRWQASLSDAADFLIDHHEIDWYVNGNVNLGYAEFLYLAWRATGDRRFAQAYNAEWAFLLDPGAFRPRFAAYGLRLTRTPKRRDGSDGAGYLVEAGAGGLGFDPEYTMNQLGTALDLWIDSGDARALRLANLLFNGLRSRISASFQLSTEGTRHTERGRTVPWVSVAIPVLSAHAGRDDLDDLVAGSMTALRRAYTQSLPWPSNPVYYGVLGMDVSAILRAGDRRLPTVAAPVTPAVFPASSG